MNEQQIVFELMDKCNIYFEDSLISKEVIIKKYFDFLITAVNSKERSSSLVMHTGSICFDIISVIVSALACVLIDQSDSDEIINALVDGDIVLYKSQRYRWRGLENSNDLLCMKLEQDGTGQNGLSTCWFPLERNKRFLKPYYGTSLTTDGRGIRNINSSRSDFISYITGKDIADIPSVIGVSVVIVSERTLFEKIHRGLKIDYGNGKSIRLLDILPASYYTNGAEPYQFGFNPSKTEAVLKVTGKMSIARDLIIDKKSNKTIGLIVLGSNMIAKGTSDLDDMLCRKSLKLSCLTMDIGTADINQYIESDMNFDVFACTREFLLQNSLPTIVNNPITIELKTQVDNIINNEVVIHSIDGGCTWDEYKKIRNALYEIKQSEWNDKNKNSFIIAAYSLLNMFTTAVFTITELEQVIAQKSLHHNVLSPYSQIDHLWILAETAGPMEMNCILIIDLLDTLYKSFFISSPKQQELKNILLNSSKEKVAIVVPKAHYSNVLRIEPLFFQENIHITTPNKFNYNDSYDKVIVVGDINTKKFDPHRCISATNIIVLLYDCETHWFKRKQRALEKKEDRLNELNGLENYYTSEAIGEENEVEMISEQLVVDVLDFEEYVESISTFDILKFAEGITHYNENIPITDVTAIGRFISGEQILFSKFYKAVVYNPLNINNQVKEINVDELSDGDNIVFAKRDDFTFNIVDIIYQALQDSNKLTPDVVDATEKAQWWKIVLRDYKHTHNLSYRDVTKILNKLGANLTAPTIRQWLIKDSHIVGPRDESTLMMIAKMTQDEFLLENTDSFYIAFKIVRKQRKKILKLIEKVIEEKLSGTQPAVGSELEIVFNNVENLSEIFELENITFLEESISIPINYANKPILDTEGIS